MRMQTWLVSVVFVSMTDIMLMSLTGVAGKAKRLWLRLMPGLTPTAKQGSVNDRPASVRAVRVIV
jgi:hypothetical protein